MTDAAKAAPVETTARGIMGGPLDQKTLEGVARTQEEAFHTLERAGSAMFEAMTKWNAELTHFVAQRMQEDIRAQKEILQCRTLDELREAQTRFFQTAIEQYSEEASRLSKIGGDLLSSGMPEQPHA